MPSVDAQPIALVQVAQPTSQPIMLDPALLAVPLAQQPTCNAPGAAVPMALEIGTLYSFINAGDGIASHTHPLGTNHYTFVLCGTIEYQVTNADNSVTTTVLTSGSVIYVPPGVEHSFTALTAGACCLNALAAIMNAGVIGQQIAALNTTAQQLVATVQQIATLTA